MKRESVRLILGVILAVLLLVPGLALAEDSSPQSDVELAEQSAQMWLETQAESVFPEMDGANLTSAQPYYDLEDNLLCYMFAVSKNGEIVGTIVVGSSLYDYDIFEVNTGTPPPIPTAAEVSSSLEEYTGLKAKEEDIGKPKRLLYLGCCAEHALYQIEGQSVAIHLRTKRGAVASDLKFYMATPDEYQRYKSNRVKLGVDGEPVILNVTHKWMGNYTLYDEHRNNNNCGPTSGSMIVLYHKNEHGYANFDDWPDCHSDNVTGEGGLYNTMHCNWPWPKEGVWPGEAGPGWAAYARYCGYSFAHAGEYAQPDSYVAIMSYINQEAPPMILFVIGGYKDEAGDVVHDFHWNALNGYQQTGDTDFIFTVDPRYSSEIRQINYALCVGTLKTYLTYIFPGQCAALEGHVTFMGRGTAPDNRWIEPFVVKLFEHGNLDNVVWEGIATTNNNGVFTITVFTPGTYDIGIKNWTCLSELETGVVLYGGEVTVVDFGTTREGDANDDDLTGSGDASLLSFAYDTWPGQPNWDARCDFDRDDYVVSSDFSLLSFNYNKWGDAYGYF